MYAKNVTMHFLILYISSFIPEHFSYLHLKNLPFLILLWLCLYPAPPTFTRPYVAVNCTQLQGLGCKNPHRSSSQNCSGCKKSQHCSGCKKLKASSWRSCTQPRPTFRGLYSSLLSIAEGQVPAQKIEGAGGFWVVTTHWRHYILAQ